jgi:3-isopropylmalate/(R)-2-methylmalate dehydratase small subunit
MKSFSNVTSRITPIPIKDIDTDMIIPAQYLTMTDKSGFGKFLFERLVSGDTDFALNNPKYADNKILVARDNFGCGSSREHAVWSILQYGFDVVIAPSFSDIFYSNALKNGLVLIKLDFETIEELLRYESEITVDLASQVVIINGDKFEFEFDGFRKDCIINGYDDLDYILSKSDQIDN